MSNRRNVKTDGSIPIDRLVLPTFAADPEAPVEGEIYYNSVDHLVWLYTGTLWKSLTEASSGHSSGG